MVGPPAPDLGRFSGSPGHGCRGAGQARGGLDHALCQCQRRRMTDQQILNIVIYGGGWLLSLLGAVGLATWWFKSQVTSGEIGGLKERCEVLEQRRQLAEQQNKITADELATVKAQLVTAQDQLKAHAPAETVAGTITIIQSSTGAAISSTDEIGRMLKAEPPTVRLFAAKDFKDSLTKKSNE